MEKLKDVIILIKTKHCFTPTEEKTFAKGFGVSTGKHLQQIILSLLMVSFGEKYLGLKLEVKVSANK